MLRREVKVLGHFPKEHLRNLDPIIAVMRRHERLEIIPAVEGGRTLLGGGGGRGKGWGEGGGRGWGSEVGLGGGGRGGG